MLYTSEFSAIFRQYDTKLRMAALAGLAGLAWGLVAPAPALAAPTDWRMACQDKGAPQGYGEMIRYNNCVRQRDCERMANTMGQMTMTMGCFGVMPDSPPAMSRPVR